VAGLSIPVLIVAVDPSVGRLAGCPSGPGLEQLGSLRHLERDASWEELGFQSSLCS